MIYFTADTHYGHKALLDKPHGKQGMALRAVTWPTVEEMDAALLEACNSTVDRRDTLYHLGDFGRKDPGHYRMLIKCKDIRFIWGNHDIHSMQPLFRHTWDVKTISLQLPNGKDSVPVWLSHYAHFVWPKSHYGALHLYGHSHGMREASLNKLMPERRSMDVGVDNIFALFGSPRPISEKEVLEILMARKGHDPVEFYRGETLVTSD